MSKGTGAGTGGTNPATGANTTAATGSNTGSFGKAANMWDTAANAYGGMEMLGNVPNLTDSAGYGQIANASTGVTGNEIVGGTGYNTVANSGNTSDYISTYMNPYEQDVVDTTMKDLQKQNNIMLNQNKANADAAGAFGGGRHGLVDATTNQTTMDTMASTAANLRNTGWSKAADLAAGHVGQNMSRGQTLGNMQQQDLANRFQNFNSKLAQGEAMMGASESDIGNIFKRAGFNNDTLATIANGMQGLGQTQWNAGKDFLSQQESQGDKAQNASQDFLDLAADIFEGNDPGNILNNLQQMLGGSPLTGNQTTTGNGTTTASPSGLEKWGTFSKAVGEMKS